MVSLPFMLKGRRIVYSAHRGLGDWEVSKMADNWYVGDRLYWYLRAISA